MKNLINVKQIETMAQSIVDLFSRPFKVDIYEFNVTINIGISIFSKDYQVHEKSDDDENDQDEGLLIKYANMALMWSKREGKNHHKFYSSDISVQNYKQFDLRNDLRRAIEKKQFEVFYQPVVRLKTTRILATEALIRWNHPDWGMVSPNEFIFSAEETGMIIEMVGRWHEYRADFLSVRT